MRWPLLLLVCACSGAPSRPTALSSDYGLRRETAVDLCLPTGEKEYLLRLRCSDGSLPAEGERGSVGPRTRPEDPNDPRQLEQLDFGKPLQPGQPDFHLVDRVELTCGRKVTPVFLDMYHCPPRAPGVPAGFRLSDD